MLHHRRSLAANSVHDILVLRFISGSLQANTKWDGVLHAALCHGIAIFVLVACFAHIRLVFVFSLFTEENFEYIISLRLHPTVFYTLQNFHMAFLTDVTDCLKPLAVHNHIC